jgi:hypothetical protein
MTVLIYVDTSKQVGDRDHLKVFADTDAAEAWFAENHPEGVAFEYDVIEKDEAANWGGLTFKLALGVEARRGQPLVNVFGGF